MSGKTITVRAAPTPAGGRWVLTWNDGRDQSPPLRLRSIPAFLADTFDGPTTLQWPTEIAAALSRIAAADRAAAHAQDHAQAVRREVAQGLLDGSVAASFGDVAAILGVTRQRVHQLLTHPDRDHLPAQLLPVCDADL